MKPWTLEQLKSRLSRFPEIKGWIILKENVHRRERYFLREHASALGTDQDRDVRSEGIQARIFVKLADKPGRQGEISKKLFPSEPLDPQLESAVAAALQTDHQEWSLPAAPSAQLPLIHSTDPRMGEDLDGVMEEVTARIARAVARKRPTRFDSAELFLSVHDREQHLSNGFAHRSSQSRIYLEGAFSYAKGDLSDEYLDTRWAVNLDDLAVDELFDESSERALHSLACPKPAPGKYAVIVDAEVLATLLNGHLALLSAGNSYNGLPFLPVGAELVPGATGELLTLSLDPTLEYGADAAAVSEQGVVQRPLRLVENNRVLGTIADKQYADYLGIEPTAVRGDVVLEPGTRTLEELSRAEPHVLEILQFSGLFNDPNSGTFGSEIRLARLFDRDAGTVTYLKGGSLSGSIVENFRGARLSSRVVRRAHFSSGGWNGQGYRGPSHALLSGVSISG